MLGLLMDRLMRRFNVDGAKPFTVYSTPRGGHFFLPPVMIRARSLYEANREFDIAYPDRQRQKTVG